MVSRLPTHREIIALTIPAAAANILEPLMSLADTLFVSSIGTEALAALAVNTAIFYFLSFVFIFVSDTTTALVGKAFGADRPVQANRALSVAGLLSLILGTALAILVVLLGDTIVRLISNSGNVQQLAIEYLDIRAWGLPAFTLILAVRGYFTGRKKTSSVLLITSVAVVLNIVLDAWLILGLEMGIEGAAYATLASQWIAAGFAVALAAWRGARPDLLGIRAGDLVPFRMASLPLTMRVVAIGAIFMVSTSLAGRIGVLSLASHHLVSEVWKFVTLLVEGFAVAGQGIIAQMQGGSQRRVSVDAARRLIGMGVALGALIGVGLWIGRDFLSGLLTNDSAVQQLTIPLLVLVGMMQPLNAAVFVTDGVFVGAGKFGNIAIANTVGATLGIVSMFVFVSLELMLLGIWLGILIFMATRAVVLRRQFWKWARAC